MIGQTASDSCSSFHIVCATCLDSHRSNAIYQNRRELSFQEWKLFFEQDYYDSCSFTRYIGGLMWRCDDDLLRSRLTANLYEEGGELDESERHAEILRRFLTQTMGTDLERLDTLPGTRNFVKSYLQHSAHEDPLYCAAFLSLGTEGICSPMFQRLVDGMLHGRSQPKFKREELRYFTIHIGCDDAHAGTLAEVMFKSVGTHVQQAREVAGNAAM
jgi:pyrroloquinoline-quinone synthase